MPLPTQEFDTLDGDKIRAQRPLCRRLWPVGVAGLTTINACRGAWLTESGVSVNVMRRQPDKAWKLHVSSLTADTPPQPAW